MAIMIWKPVAAGALTLLCISLCHADTERSGFYTIVGPDGQMIVIDRNAASKNKNKADNNKAESRSKWSLFGKNKRDKVDEQKITEQSTPVITSPTNTKLSKEQAKSVSSNAVIVHEQPYLATPQPASETVTQAQISPAVARKANEQKNDVDAQQTVTKKSVEVPQAPLKASEVVTQPITVIDGEQYIDSEYLEQREFNLEGKKRFYNLPDGIGGNEVLEREKGVDMTVFRKQKIEKPQVVDLSKNYQRIPKEQIISLTGTTCFTEKQLKDAKLFKQDEYLDFWPRPGFEPKFDFVVAKLEQPIHDIQLTSYANNMSSPKFYWPLPIFLDDKGCVMEGVNAFYQATVAPTVTMHQAIQGYLHIPQNTRYILFTPLEAAADISETQLTNKGQVRLTPIR